MHCPPLTTSILNATRSEAKHVKHCKEPHHDQLKSREADQQKKHVLHCPQSTVEQILVAEMQYESVTNRANKAWSSDTMMR